MFNIESPLVLVAVVWIFNVGAQCPSTFASATWKDNTKGSLTFTATGMSGWSFTAYAQTITSWNCLDTSTDLTLVLRSTTPIQYSGFSIYAYMCLRLTSITDYSYYYYQQQSQELNAGSERLKFSSSTTLTSTDICDDTVTVPVAEYHVIIKSGSESQAKIACPTELLFTADYTYTATDDTKACETSQDVWDVCTDTTQMTFNYSTCTQEIAYSAGGKLWCVATIYSTTAPTYPHTVVYNQDATIGATANQFACITSDGTAASVAPGNCTATQTPSAFPTKADGTTTTGHTLTVGTKYVTCGGGTTPTSNTNTTSSSSNTGLIIGIVLAVIIVAILITLLFCCYLYKRKNRVEESMKPMIARGGMAHVEHIDETAAGVDMRRELTGTSMLAGQGRQATITSIGLREKTSSSLDMRSRQQAGTCAKLKAFLLCKDSPLPADGPIAVKVPTSKTKMPQKAKTKIKDKKKGVKGKKTAGIKGSKGKKTDSKKASTEALAVKREGSNLEKASPATPRKSDDGTLQVPDGNEKSTLQPLMSSTPEPPATTTIQIHPPTPPSPELARSKSDLGKAPSPIKRSLTNLEKEKKKQNSGKSPTIAKRARTTVDKANADTSPRQTFPDPNARMDGGIPNLNLGNRDQGKSSPGRDRLPPIASMSRDKTRHSVGRKSACLSGIKSTLAQDWTFLTCCFGNRSPPSPDQRRKKQGLKGKAGKGRGKVVIKEKAGGKKVPSPRIGGKPDDKKQSNGEIHHSVEIKTAMTRGAEPSNPPTKTQLSLPRSNSMPNKSEKDGASPKKDDKVKVDVYVPNEKSRLALKDTVTVVDKTDKPRSKSVIGTIRASPSRLSKGSPGKKSTRKKEGKIKSPRKTKPGGKKKKKS